MGPIGSWREAVDGLLVDLRAVLETRLRSLVVYEAHGVLGDTSATDEGDLQHGEQVHTLVVVDDLHHADLARLAPLSKAWTKRGLAAPLVLGADEVRRSLDAFPLEFSQMIARHVVVAGEDPFAGLEVADADLRRACETQARSHLLHLRQGFIETDGDPRRAGPPRGGLRDPAQGAARQHRPAPRRQRPDAGRAAPFRRRAPSPAGRLAATGAGAPEVRAPPRHRRGRVLPGPPAGGRAAGRPGGRMDAVRPSAARLGWLLAALLLLAPLRGVRARVSDSSRRSPAISRRSPQPVNDFGGVIDPASAAAMDRAIRALQAATGDVVVVVTVPTRRALRRHSRVRGQAVREPRPGDRPEGQGQRAARPAGRSRSEGVDRGRVRTRGVRDRRVLRRDQPRVHGPGVQARRVRPGPVGRRHPPHRQDCRRSQRHAAGCAAAGAGSRGRGRADCRCGRSSSASW